MRKLGLWIGVAIPIVGALYYFVAIYPQQQFRATIDELARQLPAGYTLTYKSAEYSLFSKRATVTGVAMHAAISDPVDVMVDELEIEKPNLDFATVWSDAVAHPETRKPEAAIPVSDRITINGLAFRSASTSGTVALASVDGVRVYPWALLHAGIPSLAEAMKAMVPHGRSPQLDDIVPLLKLEAAALLGMGYDHHAVEKIAVTVRLPAMAGLPAYEATHRFGKLEGGPFDRGTYAAGEAIELSIPSGPIGSMTIGRIAMASLDVRKPLTKLLAGDTVTAALLDSLALGRIEYDGMAFQPTSGPKVDIGNIAITDVAFSGSSLKSGKFDWHGLRINRAQMPNPQAAMPFSLLDLETMTMSIAAEFGWDSEHKRLAVKSGAFKIDELGTLRFSLDLAGASLPGRSQVDLFLTHAALRFEDASLVERAMRAAATQHGADPQAYRQQLIAALQQEAAAQNESPALAADTLAFAEFLATPRALSIELAPTSPLPLSVLQNVQGMPPDKFAALVGLKVTAGQ
jgi:hypothetical protein